MSSPRPFGHYGVDLDISSEISIDNLALHELTDLLSDIVDDLNDTHYLSNDEVPEIREASYAAVDLISLSDLGKIGAIRGLCDRIELKLIEAAKS